MGKYLKMEDVFCRIEANPSNNEIVSGDVLVAKFVDVDECKYAAHAISSHDELVTEVERLRLMISECYPYIKDKADWGNEYEVDLANRLFDAAK